jgi:hypothetical protein
MRCSFRHILVGVDVKRYAATLKDRHHLLGERRASEVRVEVVPTLAGDA